ncbi:zinc-dependent alcohol dehydrogenase family protein [Romeria aff. gracilis LEGE 07310]|uniref:Zinc-dependent alcohol dehydrogenase family protein n=1 Tax=Vasconcelosia minhoensis LEGE 07310 TaxID=915328 RepID=A0A8J7AG94_9CYAN|nr:zinc-dependent alcohol dehydrogenase family protein [Romeria gracilis]MBE9078611.1 zinc-dependent alcohol dehydrogenase family protein [Romeria aff. gracilis LEGE 07310]
MKAMIIEQFGDSSVFIQSDVPKPELRPGHVLIRVEASSVNPVDYKVRRYQPPFAPELPAILHGDVAGVVEAVGDGVNEFKPGDAVYGCAGGVQGHGGALADYMLADARLIAKKPSRLDFAAAAALPLVTITAWEGLIDKANVQAGQTVLIHGGTGGVGHVALQLAKWRGAHVTATASTSEKLQMAKDLGADEVVNYQDEDVASDVNRYTNGKGFDLVFDSTGGANLPNSFEAARLNGTVVTPSSSQSYDLSIMHAKGLSLHVVFMLLPMLKDVGRERHRAILREVASLVDNGHLKPLIDPSKFNFAQVAQAHDRLEQNKAVGKIVLTQSSR